MNTVIKYISMIIALLFALTGCKEGDAASMNKIIKIRGQSYQIPAEYILPDLPSTTASRGPEMDVDDGINLEIPLLEVGVTPLAHKIPNGNAPLVRVLLYGPGAFTETNEYKLNPGAYDAWIGQGSYRQDRIIEKDDKAGLYRISWRQGAKSWQYFEALPSDLTSPKWVAGCYFGPLEPEAEDMSNVSCRTQLSTKQGDVDISFTGRYINRVDKIINGVRMKISEWAID